MKRKLLAMITALAMVLAMMPAMAFADDGGAEAIPVSFADCTVIGENEDWEAPVYYTKVESGATNIELTDLAGKMDAFGEIAGVHQGYNPVKNSNVVDVTKFSISYADFEEACGEYLDQDAIAGLEFSNIYAMFIMDDDDNYCYLVVQSDLPPKTYGFKAFLGGKELTDISKEEGAYVYTNWKNVTSKVDLYTITIPKDTASVDFIVENPVLAYNYGANPCTDDNYLDGATPDYMTGNSEFSPKIDSNGDGTIDYIQVQTPYDSANNTIILYAVTFKYEEEPTVDPSNENKDKAADEPKVTKGKTYKVAGNSYKVTKVAAAAAGTVTFTKAAGKKSVKVPKTVKLADGKTYNVTQVGAKAFTAKKIKTVTIGANVSKLAKKAFAKSKVKTLVLKTKKLKKASVKGSLKGSKVKTVKVKVGSKKVNKKYVKKYKKIFTKKNAGKKVKIK